jgi:hypothetical protein
MIIQTQRYAARSRTTFDAPTQTEESLEGQYRDLGLSAPAFAHNVKISGNVAALFHLEPNHNPKAGEPSKVWFALTKQGGEAIALDQCNCKITVYSNQKVLFQPPLSPLNAERYKALPSAVVMFPKAGIYQVEITGTPKQEGEFESFKFNYDVTVQPGNVVPSNTSESPISNLLNPDTVIDFPGILVWMPLVAMVFLGLWLVKRRNRSN